MSIEVNSILKLVRPLAPLWFSNEDGSVTTIVAQDDVPVVVGQSYVVTSAEDDWGWCDPDKLSKGTWEWTDVTLEGLGDRVFRITLYDYEPEWVLVGLTEWMDQPMEPVTPDQTLTGVALDWANKLEADIRWA